MGYAVELLERRCLFAAGPLDPAFGVGGIETVLGPQNVPAQIRAVIVLPNGNIAAAGSYPVISGGQTTTDAWFEEFGPSGNIINSQFGVPTYLISGSSQAFTGLTLLGDGNIVATGAQTLATEPLKLHPFFAQVYSPGGLPVGTPVEGTGFEAVIGVQSDGKFLYAHSKLPFDVPHVVARLNVDGSTDSTFNGGNALSVDFSPDAAIVQPDGKIVVAGGGTTAGNMPAIEILRLNADGLPDTSFRGTGIERSALDFITDSLHYTVESLALEPDGHILVAGPSNEGFQVASFTPDGHFDTTFGDGGRIDLPGGGSGSIVVGGGRVIVAYIGSAGQINVSRFLLNGQVDTGFNDGNALALPLPAVQPTVALSPDGRLVVAAGNQIAAVLATPPAASTGNSTATFSGTVTAIDELNRETPFRNVVVYIDANHDEKLDAGDPRTTTDASGKYQFTLAAGRYTVVPETGRTLKTLQPTRHSYDVTLVSGAVVTFGNFTLAGAGTISGRVYHDVNADGRPESSEPTFGNATVYLDLNHDGKFDAGDLRVSEIPYTISNLQVGVYRVRVKPDPGFRVSGRSSYTVRIGRKIAVTGIDFGVVEVGNTLRGMVFDDRNNNGTKDAGEPPLAGWSVVATQHNGPIDNPFPRNGATTDSKGRYAITLTRGVRYDVGVIQPGTGLTSPVTTQSATNALKHSRLNFAEDVGSISGTLFQDTNGNGVRDAGEPGLSGWSIEYSEIFDASYAASYPITTDASGSFSFPNLPPGDYTLLVSLAPSQASFTVTSPASGRYTLTLGPGQVVGGVELGAMLNGM